MEKYKVVEIVELKSKRHVHDKIHEYMKTNKNDIIINKKIKKNTRRNIAWAKQRGRVNSTPHRRVIR